MHQDKTKKSPTQKGKGLIIRHREDTINCTQLIATELFFSDEPKTMLQVAVQSGIERAGICWYVSKLRKADRIHLVKTALCPISRHRAGFYTTDERGGTND